MSFTLWICNRGVGPNLSPSVKNKYKFRNKCKMKLRCLLVKGLDLKMRTNSQLIYSRLNGEKGYGLKELLFNIQQDSSTKLFTTET
jgi:hypothetical protein